MIGGVHTFGTPRFQNRSMLGGLKELFSPSKRKSDVSDAFPSINLHSRTNGSEEQMVSVQENSLHTKDVVMSTSLYESADPVPRRSAGSELPLTFRDKERIRSAGEDSKCRSHLAPCSLQKVESTMRRASAVVSMPFEEQPLSLSRSPPLFDSSTAALTIESQLLKSNFLKRKLTHARLLHEPRIACSSISETWSLTNSSKSEVIGKDSTALPEPTADAYYFAYSMKSGEREEWTEGTLVSTERSKSEKSFKKFKTMSVRYSSKEAFVKLFHVTSHVVNAQLVRTRQESDALKQRVIGDWSGIDVKPHSDEEVDLSLLNNFCYRLWRPGHFGLYQRLQNPLYQLVIWKYFSWFMTACVVMNTIVLSINHYKIDSTTLAVLDVISLTFTVLFAIEMGLKIMGLGVVGYFRSRMNVFDCIVVTFSVLEVTVLSSNTGLSALRAIRVLRVFRVLRVARLFRYFTYLHEILKVIEKSLANLIYMGLLILLFLIVASLFGMQMFGGKFHFPDDSPRANYDNFHHAFLTSFQLLTMENWHTILYSGMRTNMGYFAALYFVVWIFFGNYVLLNLFLAIMLNNFGESDEDGELDNDDLHLLEESSHDGVFRQRSLLKINKKKKKRLRNILKKMEEIRYDSENSDSASADPMLSAQREKPLFLGNECKRSWHLFSQSSKFRIWCFRITSSSRFEWFILFLIALSSVKLLWETYLLDEPSDSRNVEISDNVDIVFTVLFAIEFIMKSISLGFMLGKGTYLRDTWNVLDFVIVVVSLIDISLSDVNLPIIKIFRLLRALRPLRFISHNESMRIIVNALIESMTALANVTIVVLIVFLIFAILGVSLMAGKMYSCSNSSISSESECLYYGFTWGNAPYHFDNVASAYLALFDLMSQENWPNQMYRGTDTYLAGHAMIKDYNPFMAYFFVIFVLIGNIFFLNLLLGVMFDKFEKAKRSNSSIAALLLKNEQLRWIELMKYIIRTKRVQEKVVITNRSRKCVLHVINHWAFSVFVTSCIVGNTIVLAISYDQASSSYVSALETANLAFTCLFALEAMLKLYGLTVKGYFKDRWNCFDFAVVVAPFVDLALSMTVFSGKSTNKMLTIGPQLARVLRILRVSRLLRLVKKLRMIDDLIGMISLSLPAIGNVFMLLLLIYLIYGVLGVFLFHSVTEGDIIDEDNNFSNFGRAVLILIRVSTGEDWNNVLTDLSSQTSSAYSILYLLSFVCITTFIMYNMFIMVMLQEYESYHNNPQSSFKIYKENLSAFNNAWNSSTSMESKTRLDGEGLIAFAYEMGDIIGVEQTMDRYLIKKRLGQLGLVPDDQGFVYYHDALFRFFKAKFGIHKKLASKIHKKLLEMEETIHSKKIRKLVQVDKIQSVAKLMQTKNNSKGDMRIYELIFLKAIFKTWHKYAREKKAGTSASITPAMTINFPGSNSPHSIVESGEEDILEDFYSAVTIKEPPKDGRRSITLPSPRCEGNSDVKISRTSTNYSKNRHDSQEQS